MPPQKEPVHRAIERHLARLEGQSISIRYIGDIFPGKTKSRGIRYMTYQWAERRLFVKFAKRLRVRPLLENALGEWRDPAFHSPRFFGTGRISGRDFAIWEYLDRPMLKPFEQASSEELFRIVDAIVAMNAATDHFLSADPGIRRLNLWAKPLAARIQCRRFAALEPKALTRLNAIDTSCFTHNDIAYHNILQGDKLAFLDWELASISSPGASLRVFGDLEDSIQLRLVERYSEQMRKSGFPVRVEDAYFVMGTMQVYFWLSAGLARKDNEIVDRALSAATDYIGQRL